MPSFAKHREVQAIAKNVLAELGQSIVPTDTEASIAERATSLLANAGVSETWYHNCPAFVLLGSRSCLSISGRDYKPANEPVGDNNLVTIDLSPMRQGAWGDCARSFYIEGGRAVETPGGSEFLAGKEAERLLHAKMVEFTTPKTTFQDLFAFANREIARLGFENLDFLQNVGHSIESHPDARQYVQAENTLPLGEVALFTFEPHIRAAGGRWGFKHENIYYFDSDGRITEL
ncbi:MAG: M24 family metallopeptidase [Steroidobacteraceae bacterium]